MVDLPDNVKRGDRLTAEQVRELSRLAKRGARPVRVVENSGLTLQDTPSGTLIGFDVREVLRKIKPQSLDIRYGFVTSITSGSSPQEILVRFLKPVKNEDTGAWTWQQDGDPRVALVPPNFAAVDFEKLKKTIFGSNVPIVRCERIEANWIVTFVPRWAFRTLPAGATVTRCA